MLTLEFAKIFCGISVGTSSLMIDNCVIGHTDFEFDISYVSVTNWVSDKIENL